MGDRHAMGGGWSHLAWLADQRPEAPPGPLPPFDGPELWRDLVRSARAPRPAAFPLFTSGDLARDAAAPRRRLELLRAAGRVTTLGRGRHLAVPPDAAPGWRPWRVEAAWLVAVSLLGWDGPYVSGLTAAALHGACPTRRGVVHLTGPRQARDVWLSDPPLRVRLHQRWERGAHGVARDPALTESFAGELAVLRLTTREQTALDLEHSPRRTGEPRLAASTAFTLRLDVGGAALQAIAGMQRRITAEERLAGFRGVPRVFD